MDTSWIRNLFRRGPKAQSDPIIAATVEEGTPEYHFRLGVRYGACHTPGPDYARSADHYRSAAEQNHAMAQFNLGMMYVEGQGVVRDDVEGARWIRRAADQGDAGAQFNVGTRCYRACMDRTRPDQAESRIEAYMWFSLAAVQGYRGSSAACERVTLTMSREEVAQGNQRITAFAGARPLTPS